MLSEYLMLTATSILYFLFSSWYHIFSIFLNHLPKNHLNMEMSRPWSSSSSFFINRSNFINRMKSTTKDYRTLQRLEITIKQLLAKHNTTNKRSPLERLTICQTNYIARHGNLIFIIYGKKLVSYYWQECLEWNNIIFVEFHINYYV